MLPLTPSKPKPHYTEAEAAQRLGLSIEQLRTLVRHHIGAGEESSTMSTFHPSDLVVLKFLAQQQKPA
ncbi:MAG TPA: hypothetical protein VE621_19590 [Bryobacteraceae bacterium]|nr:hypothetical protein [Bryobacteraceae bacterium]